MAFQSLEMVKYVQFEALSNVETSLVVRMDGIYANLEMK